MPVPSGRPSIGSDFHERVEGFLRDHPELGYQTTAELVRDLLRRWLEEQKAEAATDDAPRVSSPGVGDAAPSVSP